MKSEDKRMTIKRKITFSDAVRAYPPGAAYATLTCLAMTVFIYGAAVSGIEQDAQNGPEFWRLFGSYGTWMTLFSAAFAFGVGLLWAALKLTLPPRSATVIEGR